MARAGTDGALVPERGRDARDTGRGARVGGTQDAGRGSVGRRFLRVHRDRVRKGHDVGCHRR